MTFNPTRRTPGHDINTGRDDREDRDGCDDHEDRDGCDEQTTTSTTGQHTTTTEAPTTSTTAAPTTTSSTSSTSTTTERPQPVTVAVTTPLPEVDAVTLAVSYAAVPVLPHTGADTTATGGLGALLLAVGLITTALARRLAR